MVDSSVFIRSTQKSNPHAVKKVSALIEFLEKNGYDGFCNINIQNEGCKQFVSVTVSIMTAGNASVLK